MDNTGDLLLVSQVVLFNHKKSFDKLVKKYQSQIRRFFLNMTLGDKELSDDLSQETFIKAYLKIGSFKGTARFSTWLFRIAYNIFYDYARSKKSNTFVYEDINELLKNNMDHSRDLNRQIDVTEALKILRYEERIAIVLSYMEEHSHKRIAQIMNCPVGTVKSHILRGKDKLYKYFKNSGYEHARF
jgi:RNA polymerase sigma-70 factor (ECF subfamily)